MKNVSIRTKILATLVLVNVLGAIAVAVHLHNSYSAGLDVAAEKAMRQGSGAWDQFSEGVDPTDAAAVALTLRKMSAVTGTQYGLLLDKSATDAEAYAASREKAGLADNWEEGEAYALIAATDERAADRMQFQVPPETVPEIGRIVGIENGACTKTCHDNVHEEGAYWAVSWSDDGRSRSHAVFPIAEESGKPVGVVYMVEDISEQADRAEGTLIRTMLVIGVTLLVATLVLGALIDVLMFKRLNSMVASVHELSLRMAGGDFDAHFEPDGTNDEIGKFEQFFSNLIEVMSGTLKSLSQKKAG
ncbi:MAG: hypothetical protein IBX62_03365 [Coriobacteriia bacterium]|nr:hypothetical protein [Coriobacteriia bacterium]